MRRDTDTNDPLAPFEARSNGVEHQLNASRAGRDSNGSAPRDLGVQLARLGRLHAELALAEVRRPLRAAAIAAAVAIIATAAGIAALVTLLAAALAPLFGAPWPHLLIAGGGTAIVAGAAAAWSVWRLRRLALPRETMTSLMENWEWLVVQVKSRLTLR